MKYTAKIHTNADSEEVKFIGKVSANSISELKKRAREHARNSNNHLSGRLHLQDDERSLELRINP